MFAQPPQLECSVIVCFNLHVSISSWIMRDRCRLVGFVQESVLFSKKEISLLFVIVFAEELFLEAPFVQKYVHAQNFIN